MKAALCTGYGPPEVLRIQDVHRYVGQGHKKGNVIVAVADSPALA